MSSRLFLIPSIISEDNFNVLPLENAKAVEHLRVFFVEEPKSGRRFLKGFIPSIVLTDCEFLPLNEHTSASELDSYKSIIVKQDCGVISEAGCPCVADPGAGLVMLAHQNNVEVVPLVGPSSILLALMASGLNGQSFSFNGYLPKDRKERIHRIRYLEKRAGLENQTQIFMETPYRNDHLLEDILQASHTNTNLCIATDLTSASQSIKTQTVAQWQKSKISLKDKPTIFLIGR